MIPLIKFRFPRCSDFFLDVVLESVFYPSGSPVFMIAADDIGNCANRGYCAFRSLDAGAEMNGWVLSMWRETEVHFYEGIKARKAYYLRILTS